MVEVPLIGAGAGETIQLPDEVFAAPFQPGLVHNCVRAERAARRRGTHATRTRGMVSGGGAKPWRQKGTGRARAGSIRSPLWRGGGTVFGPAPRSYVFKVNRRERRAALRSALSLHAQRGTLAVLKDGAIDQPRVARAREVVGEFLDRRPTVVVVVGAQAPEALALRNLAGVKVVGQADAGVADLVGAAKLLIGEGALEGLIGRCGPVRRGRKESGNGA